MVNMIRNDLTTFEHGVNGGKAICINRLINEAIADGYTGVVTAGSRTSPQIEIVSTMCMARNISCDIFVPKGQPTKILQFIEKATNATVHTSNAGYTSTATGQAKKFADDNNLFYIPFGCECYENIEEIFNVLKKHNYPEMKHLIVPIGSGTAFVGVINALNKLGRTDVKVTGVQVGMEPQKIIDKFMTPDNEVTYEIVKSEYDYKDFYPNPILDGVELDPQYEAKCIPFLKDGDYLWIVGKRLVI